jgi:hypothetical protein
MTNCSSAQSTQAFAQSQFTHLTKKYGEPLAKKTVQ